MTCELPVYDKGTSIEFEIRDCGGKPDAEGILPILNLTGNTGILIVFLKPDETETVITRPGVIYAGGTNGDATDGIVQYITLGDEIDVIGTWKLEAVVTFANLTPPAEHTSTRVEVLVSATLRNPAE